MIAVLIAVPAIYWEKHSRLVDVTIVLCPFSLDFVSAMQPQNASAHYLDLFPGWPRSRGGL